MSNANLAAQGIADENAAFSETLARLPTTLRRGNSTFVNLRATLTDLDVLVAESKPATKDLAPFLRELRPLVERRAPDDQATCAPRSGGRARTTTSSSSPASSPSCSRSPRRR